MAKTDNPRLLALETLLDAERNRIYVKDALNRTLFANQFMDKTDRAFLTRLVEGVTEYRIRLDYVINSYSKTKVEKCKPVIRAILRMGVYQMLFMDSVPNETACDEAVKLAKKKGFHNLAGFVNGVLRAVSRDIDRIEYPKRDADEIGYLSVEYSMPQWLTGRMIVWYGAELTERMLAASVRTEELTVRVNESRISKEELSRKLADAGITVREGDYVEEALHLHNINYVLRTPGFKQGEFFVQDESSMLLFHIAEPFLQKRIRENGERKLSILDLCAAPGGKSTHFAEKLGNLAVIEARDVSEEKVSLIRDNVNRLQLDNVKASLSDATIYDEASVNQADLVIADLPCSGLGIIARKNDIKYRIDERGLSTLRDLQRRILTNAAAYVKSGGMLIFSTCTINPEENADNADWFLREFDFDGFPIAGGIRESLGEAVIGDNMLQLLPGREKCDGFFIAAFTKK